MSSTVPQSLLQMLQSLPLFYAQLSQDGRLLEANSHLLQMLGVTWDEVQNRVFWQTLVCPYHQTQMAQTLKAFSRPDVPSPQVLLADSQTANRIISIEWHITRLEIEEQDPVMVLIGHDVHFAQGLEQAQHEQESLRAALIKEREYTKLREQFFTLVSHEFRTPISAISLSADLLLRHKDRYTPQERDNHLDKILRHTRHLAAMLDDFALLNHLEQGFISFNPTYINPLTTIAEMVEDLQRLRGQTRQIRLSVDFVEIGVWADVRLLNQIVVNLVDNALKYSAPDKPVDVRLFVQDEAWVLEVCDYGIGVSEQDQIHLFEPFFRGENVGNITGTGLGLKIVKDCVDLHQGAIAFSTSPDGTLFTVRFPLHFDDNA